MLTTVTFTSGYFLLKSGTSMSSASAAMFQLHTVISPEGAACALAVASPTDAASNAAAHPSFLRISNLPVCSVTELL